MDKVNTEFIEKYQKIYEQDPTSKVFAPLAEAYRKMGLLKEAKELCLEGLKNHPSFAGGQVAIAKVYVDLGEHDKALEHLKKATILTPENFLAHELLAQSYLRLKQPKEALKAYKMLLFLDPTHVKAQRAVRKLESLTADEYESDTFDMKPVSDLVKDWDQDPKKKDKKSSSKELEEKEKRNLERYTSLADAFLVRNDIDRALETLNQAELLVGSHPQIVKRLKLIQQRNTPPMKAKKEAPIPREELKIQQKIETLELLLERLKEHSSNRNSNIDPT